MITSAQAQPFGGPHGCCFGPKEDMFSSFLILAIVVVVAGLLVWDRLTQSR